MAFCELPGYCIWSCFPGGQCADNELTSGYCVQSTPCTMTWVGKNGFSEELNVVVGVHQGSALSRLLLIIVLEAATREFLTGFFMGAAVCRILDDQCQVH